MLFCITLIFFIRISHQEESTTEHLFLFIPTKFPALEYRPTPTKLVSLYTHKEQDHYYFTQFTNNPKYNMGNCLLGGMSDPETVIKVTTSNGGIMEFYPPITVSSITDEFPGHGIFQSHDDLFCKPLNQFDELVAGQSYYLLPLSNQPEHRPSASGHIGTVVARGENRAIQQGHVRSHSVPSTPSYPPLYRMSLDYQHHLGVKFLKKTATEPYSCRSKTSKSSISTTSKSSIRTSSKSSRFWKVKLVITPQQLMEILSQEARTKELIESVRIVAKCGVAAGGILPSSAAASIVSDQWSLSSSGRSASDSSKIDALVVDI